MLFPLAGGLLWLGFVGLLQPGWSAALFLLAPLVMVPLALRLISPEILPRRPWTPWVMLVAALSVPASYLFEQGVPAAAFVVPWLAGTVWLACHGFLGWRRGHNPWISFGLIYVAVGGGWLLLARLGVRPLEFSDDIVQATATHFHFAGLALPVAAGLTVARWPSRYARWCAWGIVAGMPLVATGITLSAFGLTWPEALAAWFMAGCCWGFAFLQGRLALSVGKLSGILLGLSSLALASAMVLAALYGARLFWDVAWLDIPTMLRYHGSLQALGFALPSLAGWNLLNAASFQCGGGSGTIWQ